ncbi:glycosyltransferase family 2 protein [Rathayibacter agropyri]|uniref:glycosyltransferase family 2 protein n=1 Tax=Rathayibacter agropyri TaxID=1634927 RepID=UPI001CA3B46C
MDDGSSDCTREILDEFDDPRIRVFHQARNQGKGAATTRAVQEATGDYVIVCDADEEYRPSEIPPLLETVLAGDSELVYGSRTFGSHTSFSYWYLLDNKGVNLVTNILFNAYISDVETCFKLMPLSLYRSLDIREKGFGMEAEVTGKLLARGYRPYEVGISYKARSREEGKKITVKDGFEALWILLRIRIREGARTRPPLSAVT